MLSHRTRLHLAAAGLYLVAAGACSKSEPAATPQPAPTASAASAAQSPAADLEAGKATTGHPNLPGFVRPVGPVATVNGRDIAADRFNVEFDRLIGKGVRIPTDRIKAIARNILSRLIDD